MMRERVGEVLRRAEGMGAQQAAVSPDNKDAVADQGFATPEVALPHRDVVESGLGADLSGMRAHTDDASTSAMGAHAYMKNSDAVFSSEPSVEDVAHEAAHYVQQNDGVQTREVGGEGGNGGMADPELEAEAAAQTIAGGGTFEVGAAGAQAGGGVHQRDWSLSGMMSAGKDMLGGMLGGGEEEAAPEQEAEPGIRVKPWAQLRQLVDKGEDKPAEVNKLLWELQGGEKEKVIKLGWVDKWRSEWPAYPIKTMEESLGEILTIHEATPEITDAPEAAAPATAAAGGDMGASQGSGAEMEYDGPTSAGAGSADIAGIEHPLTPIQSGGAHFGAMKVARTKYAASMVRGMKETADEAAEIGGDEPIVWDASVSLPAGLTVGGSKIYPEKRSQNFIATRSSGGMIEDEYTVKASMKLLLKFDGVPFEETYTAEAKFKSRPIVGVSFANPVVHVACAQANQELTVNTAD
jgi:hypothetical protein